MENHQQLEILDRNTTFDSCEGISIIGVAALLCQRGYANEVGNHRLYQRRLTAIILCTLYPHGYARALAP
jgi:hypothetical protein